MVYLIKNTSIVNEGKTIIADVLIKEGKIEKIAAQISVPFAATEINGEGLHLLPGVIDDQVHFREPGLTHKANIYTEARAAVMGGVTSFMEMPNTVPPAFTHRQLEEKYTIAAQTSVANYSFYMGTSNDNADEVLFTNNRKHDICGVKIFMGSSTGNLLVDNPLVLEKIFCNSEVLIATHCEDEQTILNNLAQYQGRHITPDQHPIIRDAEACYLSSHKAIQIAQKCGTRLHILHITTAKELNLFGNMLPLADKRITSEVCVHHLHFTANDYATKGHQIKCNPAIKAAENKEALWQALLDDRLDVIATDHAPHLLSEKGWQRNSQGILEPTPNIPYSGAHAGLPLVQHSLQLMLHYVAQGRITIEKMVEKMSHAVATCFNIENRGFIREGYWADLVLVNTQNPYTVTAQNIAYKCGWSPLEGATLPATIEKTFVNGQIVYENGVVNESHKGMRLRFNP